MPVTHDTLLQAGSLALLLDGFPIGLLMVGVYLAGYLAVTVLRWTRPPYPRSHRRE